MHAWKDTIKTIISLAFLILIFIAIVNRIRGASAERNILEEKGKYTMGRIIEIRDSQVQIQRYFISYTFKTIDEQKHYVGKMPLKG